MQKTRRYTYMLWDIMSRQRMNIFKGDSKKLPSGKTNFPFASISTSWNFWRKALFLGDVPIAVCSLYIFPPYVPIQRPQKRSTISSVDPSFVSPTWRGAPVNFVSMTSYFNLLASQTSVFLEPQTTLFDRGLAGEVFPGETKMETSNGWWKSENRWRLFLWCVFGVFVGWKLKAIGKKNVKPGYTQDTPIVIVMNVLISFWFFSLKFPMLCGMANRIIAENH